MISLAVGIRKRKQCILPGSVREGKAPKGDIGLGLEGCWSGPTRANSEVSLLCPRGRVSLISVPTHSYKNSEADAVISNHLHFIEGETDPQSKRRTPGP